MADFLSELESMAATAEVTASSDEVPHTTVSKWQMLFKLSYGEALQAIKGHREDLWHARVSDEHWEYVRVDQEQKGFDRESYEYSLQHSNFCTKRLAAPTPAALLNRRDDSRHTVYIIKLEGPLAQISQVREAGQMAQDPQLVHGTGETDERVLFCKIDSACRLKLIEWAAREHPSFRPTIVRLSQSAKELSDVSMAPMLGQDTILPQFRADLDTYVPYPQQQQYPVWYFVYGNLAKPEELQRRLGLEELPVYVTAAVRGARVKTWRGKFRAMVDSYDEMDVVLGKAYLLMDQKAEDTLRFYETENYEVVRCRMEMEGWDVPGLTFRFAGGHEYLE